MRSEQPPKTRRPRLHFEPLEARRLLSATAIPWDNAASLTLSFAPDGTQIGSARSALFSTLGQVAASADWQAAVARAFQTWAQHAHINVGVVPDTGIPFGIAGPQHGDLRFGDIRVGAVPMSPDVLAVSVPHDQYSGGTWSGDILFNSNAQFDSLDEIYRIALHEAGHVLGLMHNSDPNSPMFDHVSFASGAPTIADIGRLQELYGSRHADINEGQDGNDSIDSATRIRYEDETYTGATPLIAFGDVQDAADADVFVLSNLDGYAGRITFEVRTLGISQLVPQAMLLDRTGRVFGEQMGATPNSASLRISIDSVPEEKYFLKVRSAASGLNATGAFAIIVTFDEALSANSTDTEQVVRKAFHWWGLDEKSINDSAIRQLFNGDDPDELNDDLHEDDHPLNSVHLSPTNVPGAMARYLAIGSLSDAVDVDHYEVRSADSPVLLGDQVMTVFVESLAGNGLIPAVQILNEDRLQIASTVKVNGFGQLLVQATGIRSETTYFVRVLAGNSAVAHHTGSYSISISFDARPADQTLFAAGMLSGAAAVQEYTLYLARTQLISLALTSSTNAAGARPAIWATIYDAHQKPVDVLAAAAGDVRSSVSVVLAPGEYTLQVAAKTFDGSILPDIPFELYAKLISDPIGPPVVDPNTTPLYSCPNNSEAFCYPNEFVSPDPFYVLPVPEPSLPSADTVPFTPPVDWWFWNQQFGRTNPVDPFDVNNDSKLTPHDVLAVLGDLVKHGTRLVPPPPVPMPFLDVNGDGKISPRDALLVLAKVAARPASGEGQL